MKNFGEMSKIPSGPEVEFQKELDFVFDQIALTGITRGITI